MKLEHPSGISAECIAASSYDGGPNIYTVVTRSPKWIDAELRTHRMLSQNSSSSRAIPLKRTIEEIEKDPFIPFDWRRNQKGMQGDEQITDIETIRRLRNEWLDAMYDAAAHASEMSFVHKQHVNRLLEPFTWQLKVITATEWPNFFNLRIAPGAQPEIMVLAKLIFSVIEDAELVDRLDGSWHLPFVLDEERVDLSEADTLRVSAARCARISYARHGTDSINILKDLELADMLGTEMHLTPFEHQARFLDVDEESHTTRDGVRWSGNFRGWLQHRKTIE